MNNQLQYKPRRDVDWEEIKRESLKYCVGNYDDSRHLAEEDVIEELAPIWQALKSANFNINDLFSKKLYLDIKNKELLSDFIMTVCLTRVKPTSDYVVDLMNGYIDFFFIDKSIATGAGWHPVDVFEILEYLWYCDKDEDIWWLLAQGIGNIKNLYNWYMGTVQTPKSSDRQIPPCYYNKNEKKALRMILFLEFYFADTNKAIATATRMLYNNAEARKNIWHLLLPEITEDGCICLAEEYDLSAAQIYNVVLRFIETMDGLPTGWGMDLFSKMSVLADLCYVECHPDISKTKQ